MPNTGLIHAQPSIEVCIEGQKLPSKVHNFLSRHKNDFHDSNKFVGFVSLPKQIVIVLPKVYPLATVPNQKTLQQAKLLFQTLQKVAKLADRNSVKLIEGFYPQLDNVNDRIPASRIGLADLILKDWFEYGFWTSSQQVFGLQGHQIDWERTLVRNTPMMTHSGPLYIDAQYRRHLRFEQHILTQIHQWVVREIVRNFGFLFEQSPPLQSLPIVTKPIGAIKILKQFLPKMYKNRDIRLIKILLQYLEPELKGFREHIDIYGTCTFHAIFEHCCQTLYDDQKELFPIVQAKLQWTWETAPSTAVRKSWFNKGQQADVIVDLQDTIISAIRGRTEKHQHLMILDAKYYHLLRNFERSSQSYKTRITGMPSVNDVRKQYFYQLLLELKYPNAHIKNALLFPIFGKNAEKPVCRLGTVGFSIKDTLSEGNLAVPLLLIGIDLGWLFNKYLNTHQHNITNLKSVTWNLW